MRKFFLILVLSLTACSPQSEALSWTWTFPHGVTITIPNEWYFAFRVFDYLYLQDSSGTFLISQGVKASSEDATRFRQQYEQVEEIQLSNDILLLRTEHIAEEAPDGINEIVSYFAILPTGTSISATFPKTTNIEERERLFQRMLLTVQEPVSENTLAFFGGYAGVMNYSDDWEVWNWSLADSPDLKTEETRLYILLVRRGFGLLFELSQEEIDAMSHEDLALSLLNLYDPVPPIDESVLEVEEFSETSIFTYRGNDTDIAVFSVDGELWFRFGYTNSEPSDIAEIREMMHSIIETYHLSDIYPHMLNREPELTQESTEE